MGAPGLYNLGIRVERLLPLFLVDGILTGCKRVVDAISALLRLKTGDRAGWKIVGLRCGGAAERDSENQDENYE